MGWSGGFKIGLNRSMISPEYELRFHDNPNQSSAAFSIFSTGGKTTDLKISREGPQIEGTSIIPQRWSVSFGSFSCNVIGDIRQHSDKLVRGVYAGLYVTIGGYTERVCFGQLRNISGVMGVYRLDFVDIISALAVNANGNVDNTSAMTAPNFQWFYKTGIEARLTSDYNAGDTNIAVSELGNFEFETGQNGWCLIDGDATTPSGSQSLGQVYATFSAKSATTGPGNLTATTETKTGATIYPGTAPNLTTGQFYAQTPIKPVAMLQGDPWSILAKLITSQIGSGGTFDTLPESYTAMGNFGSDLVDYIDAKTMAGFVYSISSYGPPVVAVSGYSWMIPITESWSSGFRTFVDMASKVGQWPVWRQNAISWRVCRKLNDPNIQPAEYIRESDILGFESFDLFDPNVDSIYQGMEITYQLKASAEEKETRNFYDGAPAGSKVPSIPSQSKQTFDNKLLYASSNQTSQDTVRQRMAKGDISRMEPWAKNPLIKMVLRLPLKYAELCAGDIVDCLIPSKFMTSYRPQGDYWFFKAMVSAVSFNFQEAFCNVTLHTYEES